MLQLLKKEFKLNIHWAYLIAPFIASLLIFIPQWIYLIAFFYLIWICVPNIFAGYNSQRDYIFTQMLPVSKKNIVGAKIAVIVILELIQILSGAIVAVVRNAIFGYDNFSLKLNMSFFGILLIIYGLFNIIFFTGYFKTAYHYLKPYFIGIIVIMIAAAGVEILNGVNPSFNMMQSDTTSLFQLITLIAGIIVFTLLTYFSYKIAVKRFE